MKIILNDVYATMDSLVQGMFLDGTLLTVQQNHHMEIPIHHDLIRDTLKDHKPAPVVRTLLSGFGIKPSGKLQYEFQPNPLEDSSLDEFIAGLSEYYHSGIESIAIGLWESVDGEMLKLLHSELVENFKHTNITVRVYALCGKVTEKNPFYGYRQARCDHHTAQKALESLSDYILSLDSNVIW